MTLKCCRKPTNLNLVLSSPLLLPFIFLPLNQNVPLTHSITARINQSTVVSLESLKSIDKFWRWFISFYWNGGCPLRLPTMKRDLNPLICTKLNTNNTSLGEPLLSVHNQIGFSFIQPKAKLGITSFMQLAYINYFYRINT